jgi:hypothetical protein
MEWGPNMLSIKGRFVRFPEHLRLTQNTVEYALSNRPHVAMGWRHGG